MFAYHAGDSVRGQHQVVFNINDAAPATLHRIRTCLYHFRRGPIAQRISNGKKEFKNGRHQPCEGTGGHRNNGQVNI